MRIRIVLATIFLACFLAGSASGQTCSEPGSIPPATTVVPPGGGSWNLSLNFTAVGCQWFLTTDVPWLTFLNPTSGTIVTRQFATVFVRVAPNTSAVPLHGTVTLTEGSTVIQRYAVTVTSNACSYSVDPPSAHLDQTGGSGQFTLTASPPDCLPFDPVYGGYSAALTSTASASYDHGIFYYSVPPNGGTAINATATVVNQPPATFNLTQDGGDGTLQAGCPYVGLIRVNGNFNPQCTAVGGTPPYGTWSVAGGSLPPGVSYSFNSFGGGPTTEGPFSFVMTTTDNSKPPQTVNVTVSGVVLPAAVSAICSSSGGPAQTGVPYFNACKPSGGTGNYQWTVRAGSLPNGLSLSPGPERGIIISGTPTDATPYYFVLQVADDSGPLPLTASIPFAGVPLSSLPALSLNCTGPTTVTMYSGQFIPSSSQSNCRASGGLGTIQYSILSGSLPPGLSISSITALSLSGTPTTAGDYKFTIQFSDSATPPQTVSQNFEIIVLQALTLTCSPSTGPTRIAVAFTTTCTASGGQPPYTLTSPSTGLPAGLSFSQTGPTTGVVSGTPSTAANYYFAVNAADSALHTAQASFSGILDPTTAPPRLVLTCSPSLASAEVGLPIPPIQCAASGGTPPYTWAAVGSLNGLTLNGNGATASLTGTPMSSGGIPGVLVTDSGKLLAQTANWPLGGLSTNISPALSMTCTPSNGPVSVGQVYSSLCSTSGGVQPVTWSTAGALPAGMTFTVPTQTNLTASVHGAPTAPGPYNFTFTVQDNALQSAAITQTYSGTISPVGAALLLDCSSSSGSYTAGVAITPTSCYASGGTPPYQWSISNGALPPGLVLTPVTAGMAVEGTPAIAGNYPFSIAVSDSGGQNALWPFSATVANPNYSGPGNVLPHLAFGAGGQTRFVLYSYANPSSASLFFFGDSGAPIGVPVAQPSTGTVNTASYFSQKIPGYGVLFVDTAAGATDPLTTGSAQFSGTGFGIFSYPAFNWQALVPLDTVRDSSYIVAFDNTGVLSTGVALTSTDPNTINVAVTVNDDKGNVLLTTSIPLSSNAHTSFMLNQQFPITAGRRGTVRFAAPSAGSIHAVAIRANGSALTTLPVIPGSSQSAGATLAHVTYNNGFTSTIYLVNPAAAATTFTLYFLNENGGPLSVPLFFPQTSTQATTSQLTQTLAPGAMLIVQTQANDALAGISGSALLSTLTTVTGFEIYEWTTYHQEAAVPFDSRIFNYHQVVFDNTNGYATGVALSSATVANSTGSIAVFIRDEAGNLLQNATLTLPASGHTSFMLPTNYPITSGIRGTIEFQAQYFQPIVIGIRAGPGGTLTSIPAF